MTTIVGIATIRHDILLNSFPILDFLPVVWVIDWPPFFNRCHVRVVIVCLALVLMRLHSGWVVGVEIVLVH